MTRLRKKTWTQDCEAPKCGRKAVVVIPDGKGGWTYYCPEHQPPTLPFEEDTTDAQNT